VGGQGVSDARAPELESGGGSYRREKGGKPTVTLRAKRQGHLSDRLEETENKAKNAEIVFAST